MADIFIDLDAGNDSWDGSAGEYVSGSVGPRLTLPTSLLSDTNYYLKRGTSGLMTAPTFITNKQNIIVGAYYMEGGVEKTDSHTVLPKPKLSYYITLTDPNDFVADGASVWRHDSGVMAYRPYALLGMGTLGDTVTSSWGHRKDYLDQGVGNPAGSTFTEEGDYDSTYGSAVEEVQFYVRNTLNPVTQHGTVYVSTSRHNALYFFQNNENMRVENIHFAHCYSGIRCNPATGYVCTDLTVIGCDFEHCFQGCNYNLGTTSHGAVNPRILFCNFWCSGSNTITWMGGCEGMLVKGNYLYNNGCAHSIGAVYSYNNPCPADNPCIIEDNYIDGVQINDFWAESFGYYADGGTTHTIYRNNRVRDAQTGGLVTNTGEPGVVFHNNLVFDCPTGMRDTDSAKMDDSAGTVVMNNSFVRVGIGIRIWRSGTHNAFDLVLKNNIFVANDEATPYAILIDAASDNFPPEHNIHDSNNCFFGFAGNKYLDTGGVLNQPIGPGNVYADPGLDEDGFPGYGSPVIGKGCPTLSNIDAHTRPHTGTGAHIGAVWPKVETRTERR